MREDTKALLDAVANTLVYGRGIPRDEADIDAAAVVETVYAVLERLGWAVVPREPVTPMVSAAACSTARDAEGEFEPLLDLIGFSGENKTHTVIREALRRAISASPKPPGAE